MREETSSPAPAPDDAADDQAAKDEEFTKWLDDMEARREKLTEELKELGPLPPKDIPPGAMCYAVIF